MNVPARERWCQIPGWEGLYEVSDGGRVRSVRRRTILRSGDSGHCGHQAVILCDAPRREKRYVHHLVLEAFVGPRPDGMISRHLDGDSANNRLENLAWGTYAENWADCKRHGRANIGERNGQAKLTRDQATEVLRLAEEGVPVARIVRELGLPVHVTTAEAIVRGETWTHLRRAASTGGAE